MPLLYLDTESDPVTKQPESVQMRLAGTNYIFEPWQTEEMKALWVKADAVIAFNAPYDMGVLSSLEGNTYRWTGTFWDMLIFGQKYKVRRIDGYRNIIRSLKGSIPVIDMLKLWSILVDDGREHSISLKALIERELHAKPIHYSAETAKTTAYRVQDVEKLEELWELFLSRTSGIVDVQGYSYQEWAKVCTPATLCKRAYAEQYPMLKEWQKENNKEDAKYGLKAKLERAYHGGLTIALYRGQLRNTAWYDIHGAYAHAIEYENTDRYMKYRWQQVQPEDPRKGTPVLYCLKTDAHLESIGASLKIYRTREPCLAWQWGYDILALRALFPDARVDYLRAYKPLPMLDIPQSLPAVWSAKKEQEQREHGKTTLREYYKLMSNTSYGIKAQRNPYPTIHTNMVIAGIITSRARLVLAEMVATARKHGCTWRYSDTDSICVELHGADPYAVEAAINAQVAPYSVECEHIGDTKILSLKRYIATGDPNAADKIRLHGKSIYKVSAADMLDMMQHPKDVRNTPMRITGVTAATERTYNRVLKLHPRITHPHPFMFLTEQVCDVGRFEWFSRWYRHVDTKTTYSLDAAEYDRHILRFNNTYGAKLYFGAHVEEDSYGIDADWLTDELDKQVFSG